ncbi:hypothetical protein [Endozoicomonas sp. SESOKO2]|uniref:hypothetical protein n=1 Tax=Endozoicomonas sp. SESOKO2 TaxID=2828743 RepID=UPI0021482CAA|nr:hypothetical protein [Endozoicomonas sp. SESOKO2]
MGIISGGEKVSISPTWSEHGQQNVNKPVNKPEGRHKGVSVSSMENTVPQNGKGKKLPKKSLFSRRISNPDKAAAKERKATEKKAIKAFKLALNDLKKAVNSKESSHDSVLRVIAKHVKNQSELEDLLANLTSKSGQEPLKPHVKEAFKKVGFTMMVRNARDDAHQPLKQAPDLGQSFREGLDKSMEKLRSQREQLAGSTYPDSIKHQLNTQPALASCLVDELPNTRGYAPSGSPHPINQAQIILTCQCFEQAHKIKQDLERALKYPQQLPAETKDKIESSLNEIQEILKATPKELEKLEKNHVMKGEGPFLNTKYQQYIEERSQENTIRPQTEAKAAPEKRKKRVAPAIPFQASLAALKKEKPERTNEADLLQNYLNELLAFSNSPDLVNLLGKEFSTHIDAEWSFDEYASLCQYAAEAIADTPSLTPVKAMDVAYGKLGTPR